MFAIATGLGCLVRPLAPVRRPDHDSGTAAWARGGCYDFAFSHCWVHSLGAGGIRIGEADGGQNPDDESVARNITVSDCVIEDAGHIIQAGTGVLLQQAHDSAVVHNHIHHLLYTGISTGWSWGYASTSNRNLTISFNLLHDIGQGVLSDMGCIYNLGISVGTIIDHNICHDVWTFGYGGWGSYADERTSWVTFSNNIIFHTESAAHHQHYGCNNTVANCVLAFPVSDCKADGCDNAALRSSQHGPGGGPGMNASFAFLRNIVLLDAPSSTLFYSTVSYGFDNMTFDNNVYWSTGVDDPGSQLSFPSTQDPTTFAEWQAKGKDGHSVIADPQFVDPTALDFSDLEPTSPALALGFVPIDTSGVGPRPFREDAEAGVVEPAFVRPAREHMAGLRSGSIGSSSKKGKSRKKALQREGRTPLH